METARIKSWLSDSAYPLWLERGTDWDRGGFLESLSMDGEPLVLPRRSMVQARQMFSFRVGAALGLCDGDRAKKAVAGGARSLLRDFSRPSGGFIHAIGADFKPSDEKMDLYAQAFALFGLAQAHALEPSDELKDRAKKLVTYLRRERAVPAGGFTEIPAAGVSAFQSNPHMHLFEAALAWLEIDRDPEWRRLADELLELAKGKFIDRETGLLGEFFDAEWNHERQDGKFIFEPGHQYEWSWLIGVYDDLTGSDHRALRRSLFEPSERHGISPDKFVYDQLLSDFSTRLSSSRFWPQGERIKAAAVFGERAAADEAVATLFRFLETPVPGLWFDTRGSDGKFKSQPAKASSLYHIAGAFAEYLKAN